MNLFQMEPRAKPLAKAPFLERLIDDPQSGEQTDSTPHQFLDIPQFQESIIQELSNLLDTRVSMRWSDYEKLLKQTPLFLPYGIPDFQDQNPVSGASAWKIKKILETVIGHFEPRLHNLHIAIEAFDLRTQTLPIQIQGTICVAQKQYPLSWGWSLSLRR